MNNLNEQISISKTDNEEKSKLIEKYAPFIYNTVYKKTGVQDEDFIQQARIAFCEAVDSYSENKGSFIKFAELVINRRLNDELRKRYRSNDYYVYDESAIDDKLERESIEEFHIARGNQNCKDEIQEYFMELMDWGFSINTLEQYCPKHKDTRDMCKRAANSLKEYEELKDTLLKTKRLPVKRLAKKTKLKYRFIEKHRRYIIMIFIAMNGTYNIIQEYIGGSDNE
ncbi:MAG: hypothetical protein GX319_08275 [Clostridiales bacterium]|nr:sigma factor [Bacillota bacterium]NLK04389.1 hypothetical protein [Clostridiales bacterium]